MHTRYRLSFVLSLFAALFLLVHGLVLAPPVQAQKTVEGVVTDAEDGKVIPGANVRVKNTTVGTTTDPTGEYEIEMPADRDVLVFSFVGYQEREVQVPDDETLVNVALPRDVVGMDEVVVTGLGSEVKRENLANAVTSVDAADLEGTTDVESIDGALNGKVPGAQINSYSGAPGGGMNVRLRGVSTINGNAQPLYIVDGIIVSNAAIPTNVNAVTQAATGGNRSNQDNPVNRIADLNPKDVQSIEILKGPSAAAIYGARASNGVVLIETKMGEAGETRVDFSQTLGITTIQKKLGMRDFTAETAEAAFGERGRQEFLEAQNERGFIDYEEELFGQEGILSTTSISASGGSQDTRFYLSGTWQDDEGIIERTGFERRSARLNVDHTFNERSSITGTVNYVNSETRRGLTGNDNSGTTFGISLTATPNFIDIREREDGTFPEHPFNASNPLQTRDLFTNEEKLNRVMSGVNFNYDLLNSDSQRLRFVGEGGVDFFQFENVGLFPRRLQFEPNDDQPGTSILGETNSLFTNFRTLLVHEYAFDDPTLDLTTQAGFTASDSDVNSTNFVARDLIPGEQNLDQAASLSSTQQRTFQNDRSFFFQEEANYDDKVILTAGVRGDRSSLNGDIDKFFLFPKSSLAVRLANFDFWAYDAVDQFKLRFAFGETGNTTNFGTKFTSFEAPNIGGQAGTLVDRQRGDDSIEPERQSEIETGFDLALFDRRANLTFTVYRKAITNQLLRREVPSSTGFQLETINAGKLVNRGLETSLTLLPVSNNTVEWESTINFWTNNAEVRELPVPAFRAVGGGFGATLGEVRIQEGRSPTQIVGIDDRDGDGSSDGVFQLGDTSPEFQMSFSNEISLFDGLSASFLAHWKKGGDNLNLSELLFDLNQTSPDFDEDDDGDGTPNGAERLNALGVTAENFVQDASYFRLREVGLFYEFPDQLLRNAFDGAVRRVRVGLSAKNVLTITPYKSYDPEVNNFGATPVSNGVEVAPFPSSKKFFFHLNVGL
jgi:TonB-linked SusC/RagA family outer membrane protein